VLTSERLFCRFGQAKRRLILAKNVVRCPRCYARLGDALQCKWTAGGEEQESLPAGTIELNVRELHSDRFRGGRPSVVAHWRLSGNVFRGAFRSCGSLTVSDFAGLAFQAEAESLPGSSFRPLQEQNSLSACDRTVRISTVKLLGVEGEHFAVWWEFLGVKTSLPLFIEYP